MVVIWSKERERLERERQELERLKAELERGKLEEERKRMEAEKQKLEMATLSSARSLKEIARDVRFIAYNDGTVKDTKTGLMWAARDNGRDVTWQEAKEYCENYRGGGYLDWRMTTKEELGGLNETGKGYHTKQRSYPVYLTELTELTTCRPWGLGTSGSEETGFDFLFGEWICKPQATSTCDRALPVRSGN